MYRVFFTQSSADAHLGGFYALAVANSAAVNIGIHMCSFLIIILSAYMPRSGTAGSHG